MPTEIEGEDTLLSEIDPKNELSFVWKIVDDSVRKESATKYLNDPLTRALKEASTVEIEGEHRLDKWRRWANFNKLDIKIKHRGGNTYVWIEGLEKPEPEAAEEKEEKPKNGRREVSTTVG